MGEVIRLGDRFQSAHNHLRDLAKDSNNVIIPDPPGIGEWQRIVNYRQVLLCIQEGNLAGKPEKDEHGNWRFLFKRYSAGICIHVTVVVVSKLNKLYVVRVDKEP